MTDEEVEAEAQRLGMRAVEMLTIVWSCDGPEDMAPLAEAVGYDPHGSDWAMTMTAFVARRCIEMAVTDEISPLEALQRFASAQAERTLP